jgi:hypothetical protein
MPTVLRNGPYRFFFYSADGGEPPHVHVQRDDMIAKFWLQPVRLDDSRGVRAGGNPPCSGYGWGQQRITAAILG